MSKNGLLTFGLSTPICLWTSFTSSHAFAIFCRSSKHLEKWLREIVRRRGRGYLLGRRDFPPALWGNPPQRWRGIPHTLALLHPHVFRRWSRRTRVGGGVRGEGASNRCPIIEIKPRFPHPQTKQFFSKLRDRNDVHCCSATATTHGNREKEPENRNHSTCPAFFYLPFLAFRFHLLADALRALLLLLQLLHAVPEAVPFILDRRQQPPEIRLDQRFRLLGGHLLQRVGRNR